MSRPSVSSKQRLQRGVWLSMSVEPLHADSGCGTLGTDPARWELGPTAAPCRNFSGLMDMDQDAIIQYVTDTFTGIELLRPTDGPGAGDTFIYYAPQHNLDPTHQMPFATIVTKDYGEFDNTSQLDRPEVFRLNIGVSRDAFRALFGFMPARETPDVP